MTLLVLAFDSGLQARDALRVAHQLVQRGLLTLDDAVFITRDADGRISMTRDTAADDAALGTAAIPIPQLRRHIAPGDTGLALVLAVVAPNATVELVRMPGARLVYSELPPDTQALAGS